MLLHQIRWSCVAAAVSLAIAVSGRAAEPDDWNDPNWQLLREAQVPRGNAALIAYLRDQCGDDDGLARVDALVRQLGSDDFDERERATKALPAVGVPALTKLRAALRDGDAETSRRAADCIARIEAKWRPELALAAVRVLVRRGCVEAIPALVRFLPCADFEELDDAVWFGLDSLAVRQGKIDPSLMDALRSPVPVRRAAAACIVGRRGDADQRAAVRKLLTDAEPEVRLRAAQGLLAAKEKTGVPALIVLLEATPVETAWQAEELLRYVAGKEAPAALIGAGAADDRRACRQAWEAWWKERGPDLDLAKLDATSRRPGLILLCDGGLEEEATGHVWLLGCDGVTRWELRKLTYPSGAMLLGGGRLVVTERWLKTAEPMPGVLVRAQGLVRALDGKVLGPYQGVVQAKVSNGRAFDRVEAVTWATRVEQYGDANPRSYNPWVWKVRMPGVLQAVRLPNANVLAGGVGRVVEIDREGRVVWSASFEDQAQQVWPCLNRVRLGFDETRAELDLTANQLTWLQGLSGKDAAVRRRTAEAIGALGRWGQEAGPALIPLLKDSEGTVRDAARRSLARIYPVVPEDCEKDARDTNPKARREGLNEENLKPRPLENVEADAKSGSLKDEKLSLLLELLKDKDPLLRWEAAGYLCCEELHGQEVVPALIDATHDPDVRVRAAAAQGLGHFGTNGKAAIPGLVACLKDKDELVRGWAAQALGEIDPSDDRAFPALLDAAQDKRGNGYAGYALSRCKWRDKVLVPILLKQLHSNDSFSVADEWIIRLLGKLGPDAKSAVPALSAIVADKSIDPQYRAAAAFALGDLGSTAKEALPDLKRLHGEHGHDSFAEELQKVEAEIEDD